MSGQAPGIELPSNRLIHASSPYLRQHAHNPVDWHPWDEEAIARAQAEDKPIFLSIGYAACHWCHVMERESFMDERIAAFLNDHFISIKVDREERPDLDAVYMRAVTAMNGSGGWPMSVFLTPDLKPFYGGAYFPPEDRYGYPGFPSILQAIATAWKTRRNDLLRGADELTRLIAAQPEPRGNASSLFDPHRIHIAARQLAQEFDHHHGGWGGAPKFPACGALLLLLRAHRREASQEALLMATTTLDHMAMGGIYDHLGGGFHRYTVDESWLIPHFEKMLYDNAQLAQAYLEAWQSTGDPAYRRVVCETLDYLLRDMQDPCGAFHASEDADSGGVEGQYYLWTHEEIISALGAHDGALFCACYNVREEGNFSAHDPAHRGHNILHRTRHPAEIARDFGISADALETQMAATRARLLAVRYRRERPGRDDKIVAAWNAMAISAFARAAGPLNEGRYLEAAVRAGNYLREVMIQDGVLLRSRCGDAGHTPGFLEDYALAVNAFIDLYEAGFDPVWLDAADGIAAAMLRIFWDEKAGGFFHAVEQHHGPLIARLKPMHDASEPSGNAAAALALLRLGRITGNEDYRQKAEKVIALNAVMMARAPHAMPCMILAADALAHAPVEIVFAGDPQTTEFLALRRALHGCYVPDAVVIHLPACQAPHPLIAHSPLVVGKSAGDAPEVFICRDRVCAPPAHTPEAFLAMIQ